MPWIESHQELERHPKTLDLMNQMGWDLDVTIGKLHRFWWWCVDYAEDGDLRKHNDNRLSAAVGVSPSASKQFMAAMVQSGWIDREPYFRVHDWWHYFGEFLKAKYKNYPERWQLVRDLYSEENKTPPKTPPKPVLPNLTKPNQTNKAKAGEKPPVIVNKIVDKEKKELYQRWLPHVKTALDLVLKDGFNIYKLINKARKQLKWTENQNFPNEVILGVCASYHKDKDKIKDPFPWFMVVLRKESEAYFAEKNIAEHRKIKDQGAMSLADILRIAGSKT